MPTKEGNCNWYLAFYRATFNNNKKKLAFCPLVGESTEVGRSKDDSQKLVGIFYQLYCISF